MEKSFLKMKLDMQKEGYRNGVDEGKQKVFQKYFDQGYFEGFKNGYALGQHKGELWVKSIISSSQHSSFVASNGSCIMCKSQNLDTKSIVEIKEEQKQALQNTLINER